MNFGKALWRAVLALEKLPRSVLLAVGLAFTAGVAVLDLDSDYSAPLAQFYLIPVVGVAWLTRSASYGLVVAAVAAAIGPVEAIVDGGAGAGTFTCVTALLHFGFYVVVVWLLSLVWRDRDLHEQLATVDARTGLANVRAFRELASAEVERSRRYGDPLSLAYVDVDDFKAVNDRWGHEEGDRVLAGLAVAARSSMRSPDVVGRLGGDEFAVLMPETGSRAALQTTRRLIEVLRSVRTPDGESVTCSVGVVTFVRPPASLAELLAQGDAAMYEVKDAGKDALRHVIIEAEAVPEDPAVASV